MRVYKHYDTRRLTMEAAYCLAECKTFFSPLTWTKSLPRRAPNQPHPCQTTSLGIGRQAADPGRFQQQHRRQAARVSASSEREAARNDTCGQGEGMERVVVMVRWFVTACE
jgi:hypothetical protein